MKLNDLIERLREIQDSKGNIEVIVQEYGRGDAPRAFANVEYATPIKVKTHTGNTGLYEAEYNPEISKSKSKSEVKEACLIAYV